MQIAVGKESLLDACLHAFAEERAIWQHETSAAAGLEQLHDEHQKEVGGLPRAELGGEVRLDAILLHAAEGRVCHDHVHTFLWPPITQWTCETIVVPDVGRDVDPVQEEIGHAQDVRQMLFLDASEALLNAALVCFRLRLLAKVLDGVDKEAASAARGIENCFTDSGIHLLDDELRDGSRSVEFARIAGGLKIS